MHARFGGEARLVVAASLGPDAECDPHAEQVARSDEGAVGRDDGREPELREEISERELTPRDATKPEQRGHDRIGRCGERERRCESGFGCRADHDVVVLADIEGWEHLVEHRTEHGTRRFVVQHTLAQ